MRAIPSACPQNQGMNSRQENLETGHSEMDLTCDYGFKVTQKEFSA